MLKHSEHHNITFLFVHLSVVIWVKQPNIKSNANDLRVKSSTKANTDLHNGNILITS